MSSKSSRKKKLRELKKHAESISNSLISVIIEIDPLLYTTGFRDYSSSARDRALKREKCCRCCRDKRTLTVHHIVPISVNHRLRNEDSNLIVLCEDCHEQIGHCGNASKYYNPLVLEDISAPNTVMATNLAFKHRITLPNNDRLDRTIKQRTVVETFTVTL